jgi:hypothetical protein
LGKLLCYILIFVGEREKQKKRTGAGVSFGWRCTRILSSVVVRYVTALAKRNRNGEPWPDGKAKGKEEENKNKGGEISLYVERHSTAAEYICSPIKIVGVFTLKTV